MPPVGRHSMATLPPVAPLPKPPPPVSRFFAKTHSFPPQSRVLVIRPSPTKPRELAQPCIRNHTDARGPVARNTPAQLLSLLRCTGVNNAGTLCFWARHFRVIASPTQEASWQISSAAHPHARPVALATRRLHRCSRCLQPPLLRQLLLAAPSRCSRLTNLAASTTAPTVFAAAAHRLT